MTLVILGGGIKDGSLPPQVEKRLLKGLALSKKREVENFLLCGKWSFLLDEKPKKTEARLMKEFLVSKGVDESRIHLEEKSMDTISNAYFAKTEHFLPEKEIKGLIITSSYHLPRVKYIFEKMFGDDYDLEFKGIKTKASKKLIERQKELLDKFKKLTKDMKDGEHEFFRGKFFNIEYYKEERPSWVKEKVSKG